MGMAGRAPGLYGGTGYPDSGKAGGGGMDEPESGESCGIYPLRHHAAALQRAGVHRVETHQTGTRQLLRPVNEVQNQMVGRVIEVAGTGGSILPHHDFLWQQVRAANLRHHRPCERLLLRAVLRLLLRERERLPDKRRQGRGGRRGAHRAAGNAGQAHGQRSESARGTGHQEMDGETGTPEDGYHHSGCR